MIKSIVRRMLLVQIFSNLASIICSFIDNIITGQFLGVQSLAVTGLVTPVSLTMVAIGSMLSAGAQIHCGKSIAVGDQKRVDSIFSTNFLFTAGLSVLICFLCILFRFQLGAMLCSGKKEVLSNETASYLVGYILGAPGILGTAILTPFLFITGHGNLQMVSVLIVTVLDFILDLLNVLVFHGGLLGMGLATAISYNLALIFLVIVLIRYRVFPLSVKGYSWNILSSLITSGLPVAVGIMSATLMVFGINRILIGASGEAAVTVFSVTYSVGNVISAITSGVGDVSRSLSGLYYGERDLDSLREMFRCLWRYSLVLCLCIGCAVILFASGIASLFVSDPGEIKDMITLGIRFYCLGLFPCCIVFSLKGMYQSTEHPVLNNIIPLLEYTTFPVLAVLAVSQINPFLGGSVFFIAGEVLTLLCLFVYISIRESSLPWQNDAYMLLRKDKPLVPEKLLQADLKTVDEVIAFSQTAEQFVRENNTSNRISAHIGICVEEIGVNVITHGFSSENNHFSIRLLLDDSDWVLRFRDDCNPFDPTHYIPKDSSEVSGIRLALAVVRNANYTYSLGMNNLLFQFPSALSDEPSPHPVKA